MVMVDTFDEDKREQVQFSEKQIILMNVYSCR